MKHDRRTVRVSMLRNRMMHNIINAPLFKSIAAGQGLWLSSKALAVALVVFELLLVVVGVVVYYWTKSK